MWFIKQISLIATLFVAFTLASSPPSYDTASPFKCGEVNVLLTGVPPYHPIVRASLYKAEWVEQKLREDQKAILEAGYNYRIVFAGPERGTADLASRLTDVYFHAVGVGFGERGSNRTDVTEHFEQIIATLRKTVAPETPFVFNQSPNTTLPAFKRNVPLPEGCPMGRDLGWEVYCDICG